VVALEVQARLELLVVQAVVELVTHLQDLLVALVTLLQLLHHKAITVAQDITKRHHHPAQVVVAEGLLLLVVTLQAILVVQAVTELLQVLLVLL
jgi:hypothetical protein